MEVIIVGLVLMFGSIWIGSWLFPKIEQEWVQFAALLTFVIVGVAGLMISIAGL